MNTGEPFFYKDQERRVERRKSWFIGAEAIDPNLVWELDWEVRYEVQKDIASPFGISKTPDSVE